MSQRKIKFIRDYTVQSAGGQSYTKGDVIVVESASADHFIRRGAAVEATPAERTTEEKPAAEKPQTKKKATRKKR